MKRNSVLVIHGGTGNRPDDKRLARIRQRLRAICQATYEYLQHHAALDSVVFAVSLLEDEPLFNAGTGSCLQRDGKVRLSALDRHGHFTWSTTLPMLFATGQTDSHSPIRKLLMKELLGSRSIARRWDY